eukprot:5083972-Pleurochrysis_carterae.AAC.6
MGAVVGADAGALGRAEAPPKSLAAASAVSETPAALATPSEDVCVAPASAVEAAGPGAEHGANVIGEDAAGAAEGSVPSSCATERAVPSAARRVTESTRRTGAGPSCEQAGAVDRSAAAVREATLLAAAAAGAAGTARGAAGAEDTGVADVADASFAGRRSDTVDAGCGADNVGGSRPNADVAAIVVADARDCCDTWPPGKCETGAAAVCTRLADAVAGDKLADARESDDVAAAEIGAVSGTQAHTGGFDAAALAVAATNADLPALVTGDRLSIEYESVIMLPSPNSSSSSKSSLPKSERPCAQGRVHGHACLPCCALFSEEHNALQKSSSSGACIATLFA